MFVILIYNTGESILSSSNGGNAMITVTEMDMCNINEYCDLEEGICNVLGYDLLPLDQELYIMLFQYKVAKQTLLAGLSSRGDGVC
jgi:hypothetical protein